MTTLKPVAPPVTETIQSRCVRLMIYVKDMRDGLEAALEELEFIQAWAESLLASQSPEAAPDEGADS